MIRENKDLEQGPTLLTPKSTNKTDIDRTCSNIYDTKGGGASGAGPVLSMDSLK